MKFLISTIFLSIFSQTVWATSFSSTIYSIDYGKKTESDIVKFDNGRVGFLDLAAKDLKLALKTCWENHQNVKVMLDRRLNIVSAQSFASKENNEQERQWAEPDPEPYRPTVLRDTNAALEMLNKMRRDYTSEGQCYNRAHVWVYEEYQRTSRKSMKLFMFFTNRYINNYRFHWWFHVTPMVHVANGRRTLDRRYTSNPLPFKTWTDVFIKSKRTCPTVKKFDDYANYQQEQDCYLIPVSMYYVIPRDIEKRDLTGIEKTSFIQNEIDRAYKDAFKGYSN